MNKNFDAILGKVFITPPMEKNEKNKIEWIDILVDVRYRARRSVGCILVPWNRACGSSQT